MQNKECAVLRRGEGWTSLVDRQTGRTKIWGGDTQTDQEGKDITI